MTTSNPTQQDARPPDGVFRELLYIHAHLRNDLATVRRLAGKVRDGLSPATILEEIRSLETSSPLWQLRHGCMRYCWFVHGHHSLEDTHIFPVIRKREPVLATVVDKLEADHQRVHEITERIAEAAERVPGDATGISRFQLVERLEELERHLLEHLTFEERSLESLLRSWDSWPVE